MQITATLRSDPLIADLPIDDYHRAAAVGSTFLKVFATRSPLHAWSQFLDPEREEVDKPAYRLGRAWHAAVFEPEQFAAHYVVDHDTDKKTTRAKLLGQVLAGELALEAIVGIPDDIPKTSKEGKLLYAENEQAGRTPIAASERAWIVAEHQRMAGKDVLSAKSLDSVRLMAEVARAHPISRVIFETLADLGQAETSLFDTDPVTGLALKVRPDYLVRPCSLFPNGVIVDGKTCNDASREGFAKSVWNYSYGLQAALYTTVAQRVLGTKDRPAFLWLAAEKARPFACQYFAASDGLLAFWDARIAELLPQVTECLRTGQWHGYPTTVDTLALPAWAERQLEADNDDEPEVKL